MRIISNIKYLSPAQTESAIGHENDTGTVKTKQPRRRVRLWTGWRRGVIISVICNILALVINSCLLAWAISQRNRFTSGWILWEGSHDSMNIIDTLAHLAINVISTIILAGSNYTLQILLAPMRKDIDEAHRQKLFLDIGISSLRNWRYLSWQRKSLFTSLFIMTLPIHLLYNSIIVSTSSSYNVDAIGVVTADFLQVPPSKLFPHDIWSSARSWSSQNSSTSDWTMLNTVDCVNTFTAGAVYEYVHVLFFTNYTSDSNYTSWYYSPYGTGQECDLNSIPSSDLWITSFNMTSSGLLQAGIMETSTNNNPNVPEPYIYSYHPCAGLFDKVYFEPIWASIKYCLAERVRSNSSKIELIPQLVVVLIMCNMVKVVILSALIFSNFDPLVTIGDAIASFLDNPDPTTRYFGPISVTRLNDQTVDNLEWPPSERKALYRAWKAPERRYSDTVTTLRWRWSLSLCIPYFLATLALAFWTSPLNNPTYVSNESGTVLKGGIARSSTMSLTSTILLVNLPQLALSGIYLVYNALFTCILLSKEWLSYCKHRKGLRVTSPQGEQRSSYFLSLPYRYFVPLAMKTALMHWIWSQSMFSVRIDAYESDLTPIHSQDNHSIGISHPGLILSTLLTGMLLIVPVWMGTRELETAMPLVRSNSLAISAACQPSKVGLSIKKLQYGVISELPSGRFCVGFSDKEVMPLIPGQFYE